MLCVDAVSSAALPFFRTELVFLENSALFKDKVKNTADDSKVFNINFKSFIIALIMIALLMVATYGLTTVIPHGEYQREMVDGVETIISGTYEETEGGVTLVEWLTSPIRLLWAEDSITTIAIIFFLLVIGGAFSALDSAGILAYMLGTLYEKFNDKKYTLLAVVTLFFMTLGSVIGTFEEAVPMVPICVALAYALGWDALVGLGMSLLAVGCGFSCGISNPFTVGVAQNLANLPIFSGISLRVLTFVLVYLLILAFLNIYARSVEKDPTHSLVYDAESIARWVDIQYAFSFNKKKSRALTCFAVMLVIGIGVIIASAFYAPLSSVIMPVIGVIFFFTSAITCLVSGMRFGKYLGSFCKGVGSVFPAALLLLMANSVKFTLTESKSLDTILLYAEKLTTGVSPLTIVFVIYALSLFVNLFVASGSAEAMLLIPLLVPLAELTGISKQLVVLSFVYGDGFSDLFFPTSPIMLISLSLVGVSYSKWVGWTFLVQTLILGITVGLLALGFYIGY